MSDRSRKQQALDDQRDNRRVFVFGVIAAIVVLVGALLYFYEVDKRAEAPSRVSPAAQVQEGAPMRSDAPAPEPSR